MSTACQAHIACKKCTRALVTKAPSDMVSNPNVTLQIWCSICLPFDAPYLAPLSGLLENLLYLHTQNVHERLFLNVL